MSEDQTQIEATEVTELPTLEIAPGISISELDSMAEAFYNDFDPEKHDEADMMAAHTWASALATHAKKLKGLSSVLFVKWLEHRGSTHPVLEAKSKTPKGQERKQKTNDDGTPMTKFWPAEVIFGGTRFMCKNKVDIEKKLTPGQMLELLMTKSGGDFDQVAGCLSSDAFKQGEVRTSFGLDVWDECFEKVESREMDDGSPRKRQLEEVQTFFVEDALRRRASMDAERERLASEEEADAEGTPASS